ncbi:MAG TPA: hypothetical protein VKP30_19750 [Polyangiaceae bacterium]|nr:hypothetical protein [Polyangiaceae bacterium]
MSAMDDPRNDDANSRSADGPDPELIELPPPRRPFRKLTLVSLSLTLAASVAMIASLSKDAAYALSTRPASELGELAGVKPQPPLSNTWVRGDGEVEPIGGIRYERPLESDSFRLAKLQGNAGLWVQMRVPAGYENEHFVPPTTFSGRLVPLGALGLRYSTLKGAPEAAGWQTGHLPENAWVLIDGETPSSTRWIVGLVTVFAGFAAFCVWALYSLVRPRPA